MNKQNTQKQHGRAPSKASASSQSGERKRADTGQSGKPAKSAPPAGVEGEGSYTATRRYNEHLAKHIETHDVEQEAEEARAALEGDEREELQEAERQGKRGPSPKR